MARMASSQAGGRGVAKVEAKRQGLSSHWESSLGVGVEDMVTRRESPFGVGRTGIERLEVVFGQAAYLGF